MASTTEPTRESTAALDCVVVCKDEYDEPPPAVFPVVATYSGATQTWAITQGPELLATSSHDGLPQVAAVIREAVDTVRFVDAAPEGPCELATTLPAVLALEVQGAGFTLEAAAGAVSATSLVGVARLAVTGVDAPAPPAAALLNVDVTRFSGLKELWVQAPCVDLLQELAYCSQPVSSVRFYRLPQLLLDVPAGADGAVGAVAAADRLTDAAKLLRVFLCRQSLQNVELRVAGVDSQQGLQYILDGLMTTEGTPKQFSTVCVRLETHEDSGVSLSAVADVLRLAGPRCSSLSVFVRTQTGDCLSTNPLSRNYRTTSAITASLRQLGPSVARLNVQARTAGTGDAPASDDGQEDLSAYVRPFQEQLQTIAAATGVAAAAAQQHLTRMQRLRAALRRIFICGATAAP